MVINQRMFSNQFYIQVMRNKDYPVWVNLTDISLELRGVLARFTV
jgi:hypothetical protein